MTPPLSWMRYGLIFVSALAAVIEASNDSADLIVAATLLLLLLVRARELWPASQLQWAFALAETVAVAWLYSLGGGFLFVAFGSTLISLFRPRELPMRWLLAAAVLAAMNAMMTEAAADMRVLANVLLAAVAYLLADGLRLNVRGETLQQLYDELRHKHYELEEARKQIIEYAQKVENIAQIEERSRISREIHDDLGHKLIRLKLMLEAALHIAPTQPDKGFAMIGQVRDQLTDSMETLRATVRKLKPDDALARSYSIEALVEEIRRENHLRINFEISGMPYTLYPSCEVTLYRNAQEAITNAVRHGKAGEVTVRLAYEPRQVAMSVSNDGATPETIGRMGLGMSGMEERTRMLGGRLHVRTEAPFTVTTVIPNESAG